MRTVWVSVLAAAITLAAAVAGAQSPSRGSSTDHATARKAPKLKYRAFFDAELAATAREWDRATANVIGCDPNARFDIYQTEFIVMGALSMFEATQLVGAPEAKYLDHAVRWIENWTNRETWSGTGPSINKIIIDSHGDKNWSGSWTPTVLLDRFTAPAQISYPLCDLQGMVQMARAVRIIKSDPGLNGVYGGRADAIADMIQHMVVKILVHRGGEASWFRGYVNNGSGPTDDKPMQLLAIFVEMSRAGYKEYYPGKTYHDLASQWLALLMRNKVSSPPTNGIASRDAEVLGYLGLPFKSECQPLPTPCSWDTPHYNRWAKLIVYAYDAGFQAVPLAHIRRTANLFARVIWDRSVDAPRFSNRTDGDNSPYRIRGPWEASQIFDGFAGLGRFDADALRAGEAMMDCVIRQCATPSMNYNNQKSGRLALAGEVTLARVRFELGR
jgi:hypothetical protein